MGIHIKVLGAKRESNRHNFSLSSAPTVGPIPYFRHRKEKQRERERERERDVQQNSYLSLQASRGEGHMVDL